MEYDETEAVHGYLRRWYPDLLGPPAPSLEWILAHVPDRLREAVTEHLLAVVDNGGKAWEAAGDSGEPYSVVEVMLEFPPANEDVSRAIAEAIHLHGTQQCERALHEHGLKIEISRCPKCTRVVASPKARQCFWCVHEWH